MSDLQGLIMDLGEKILELPDFFEKGFRFPLRDVDEVRRDMEENVGDYSDCNLNCDSLLNQIYEALKDIDSPKDSDIIMASELGRHDLGNIRLHLNGVYLNLSLRKDISKFNLRDFTLCWNNLVAFRAFGLSMAYLASEGDERVLMDVPVSQLEYLLQIPSKNKEGEYKLFCERNIQNPEFVALWQLVKNAPTDFTLIGLPSFLTVMDSGEGIRDEEGNPLERTRVPEIFGEYSTKGRGFGLQVAKRLMELRGGSVDVTCIYESGRGFNYQPRYDEFVEVSGEKKGTRFNLSLPK